MGPLTGLFTLRDMYPSDEDYLTFFGTTVSKAVTSLLQCMIHKDILWKPINHKILLTCRDSRAVVRLMAVSMLQYVFNEVKYLLLCSTRRIIIPYTFYILRSSYTTRLEKIIWPCCLNAYPSYLSCWKMDLRQWYSAPQRLCVL